MSAAPGPMRVFRVEIKRGKTLNYAFEAMGTDSMAVATQHQGLCAEGEIVKVTAVERLSEVDRKLAAMFAGDRSDLQLVASHDQGVL